MSPCCLPVGCRRGSSSTGPHRFPVRLCRANGNPILSAFTPDSVVRRKLAFVDPLAKLPHRKRAEVLAVFFQKPSRTHGATFRKHLPDPAVGTLGRSRTSFIRLIRKRPDGTRELRRLKEKSSPSHRPSSRSSQTSCEGGDSRSDSPRLGRKSFFVLTPTCGSSRTNRDMSPGSFSRSEHSSLDMRRHP